MSRNRERIAYLQGMEEVGFPHPQKTAGLIS